MSPENETVRHGDARSSEPWLQAAVDELRQPLAPSVAGQLRAARRTTLTGANNTSAFRPVFSPYATAALALGAVVLITYLLQQPVTTPQNQQLASQSHNTGEQAETLLEDMLIIAAPDSLEFYQQLEFLEWLEKEG